MNFIKFSGIFAYIVRCGQKGYNFAKDSFSSLASFANFMKKAAKN